MNNNSNNNNFNFTDDIQEWINMNKQHSHTDNSHDPFEQKWNQIGQALRSTLTSTDSVMTSFNAVTLNDFIKILPNASPDSQNFWSSPVLPNFKFTTMAYLNGEEGFYKNAVSMSSITFVAFEDYSSVQPKIIEYEQCKLIILPYVQSPFTLFFFLQHFQMNHQIQQIHQIHQIQQVQQVQQHNTSSTSTTETSMNNVDVLLEKWKLEKPNMKPTIPKLSDFANVEQEKIHKWLKNNGRSWSNMLVTYGFR